MVPALIDPHEHLLGGSGEQGYATQTPEITLEEILPGGITSVIGCLGVDTTMEDAAGLLGRSSAPATPSWASGGGTTPPRSWIPPAP